ncbi:hypothetical protein RhiJN_10167 [Ceratobasidium sp. AG-Ba]|nr:hypothetical protein RhiJN_10167 [Ceratobasidium sp. AG-Ba]QRW10920.1 hypothetical protein RhiLY_09919 [Ceratobasidium sp. AG-Ba]
MGGLLTAEVAFAAPPNRVIGLISFDVPFLGVHPHVILSGIASLFKAKEGKSESEMNSLEHVEIVPKRDGRPYMQGADSSLSTLGVNAAASSSALYLTPSNGDRSRTPVQENVSLAPDPPLPSASSQGSLPTITLPPSLHLSSPRPPNKYISPKLEQAFETFGLGPIPQPVHDVLHFFDKHRGIGGFKDWIVQVFEFGGCLLDPYGLIARYEKMQAWGSDENAGPYGRGWVNFWTITVPKRKGGTIELKEVESEDREADLAEAMDLSKMMAEESKPGNDRAHSPTPSTISTTSSTHPSLSQTISSTLSPSTTLVSTDSALSHSENDSKLKVALEELQQQMSAEGISKEEKAILKEKEKQLKAEQKELEKEEKAARKEEERRAKEAAKQAKREAKERQKSLDAAAKRAREADKVDSPHHFVVLPRKGTDQQWICVPVAGADSEVSAHCGIFFREENLEYDRLVADVGNVVRSFWDGNGGTRHLRKSP